MNTEISQETKLAKLAEWNAARELVVACKPLLDSEMALRKEVVKMFFPDAREGTTNLDLAQGWKLKAVVKLTRKIDEAALPAVGEQLREIGVNPDTLVEYKPEVVTAAYRALSDASSAIFDNALTTSPASPTLALIPPKEKK